MSEPFVSGVYPEPGRRVHFVVRPICLANSQFGIGALRLFHERENLTCGGLSGTLPAKTALRGGDILY